MDPLTRSRLSWVAVVSGLVLLAVPAFLWPTPSIVILSLVMAVISAVTLAFQLYAWRTPDTSSADDNRVPDLPLLRVAIFLAARKESTVLKSTLDRMVSLNHPRYRVHVIVDHRDDHDTVAIAKDYARAHPHLISVVEYPDVSRSSKPIALNEAMRRLEASGERWDVVGVADAEDRFHVGLLDHVDHLFRATGASIVQGAVQLTNFETTTAGQHYPDGYLVALRTWCAAKLRRGDPGPTPRWLSTLDRSSGLRRWASRLGSGWWRAANCLEYFKWFTSRLKLQAEVGVIPLGGNTVFFTRAFMSDLYEHTGTWWDEECLTEDAKIGMLASALGHRVEVFSIPSMATREETPASLVKFVRQRVRWMQGFIQVFFEGSWRLLPTVRQRLLAIFVLGFQFFQAFATVLTPVAITLALTHKAPTGVALFSIVPLMVFGWNVVIDLIMLRDFGNAYAPRQRRGRAGSGVRLVDYLGIAFGAYLFQLILSVSAVWAIQRSLANITNWVKTEHTGAHLGSDPVVLLDPVRR